MGQLTEMFTELLTGLPVSAAQRAHIEFLRERAQHLEKQIADLEQENARLKARLAELDHGPFPGARADEFIEHRGVLFKRKPAGGYDLLVPHCVACRRPLGQIHPSVPYSCGHCKITTAFTTHSLYLSQAELKATP